MSWSEQFPNVTRAELEQAEPRNDLTTATDESRAQFEAAKASALAMVDSGVVGSGEKVFTATLAGHANPGHEPTAGWSNDTVSVSVFQATPVT